MEPSLHTVNVKQLFGNMWAGDAMRLYKMWEMQTQYLMTSDDSWLHLDTAQWLLSLTRYYKQQR